MPLAWKTTERGKERERANESNKITNKQNGYNKRWVRKKWALLINAQLKIVMHA